MLTFNLLAKIVRISIQPSRYKSAESNLLGDKKGLQHWNQVVVWVIHQYTYVSLPAISMQYVVCVPGKSWRPQEPFKNQLDTGAKKTMKSVFVES